MRLRTSFADQFLAQFITALSALKVGNPMLEATTHGPLSSEAACELGNMGIEECVNKKPVWTVVMDSPA